MKKLLLLAISIILVLGITACGQPETPNGDIEQNENGADVVTTASIVNNEAAFLSAAGEDGTWIIATLKDLEIDEEIFLEGEFTNRDVVARKIALYTQDDDRNVVDRFTLTAPKLTVRSENTTLQGGTFIGDIYVEATGFQVVDATVDGNIYFENEEAEETATIPEGTVTGVQELISE